MTHTVLEVRHRHLTWLSSLNMSTFCTGLFEGGTGNGGWMLASSPEVADRPDRLALSCCHTSSHNRSSAGVRRRPSVIPSELLSAALDVLLDDHAAVSEERAGQ